MELKFKKINVETKFYDGIVSFKLLNYDELPYKFISQTNLYGGDDYYSPNTEGAPIRPCVCLAFHNWRDTADYDESPWYEDYIEFKEIKFDPFTGEEIKITIVEEQDVSEEVKNLEKEYDEISDKLRKINYDEINELRNRQHEIEEKISNLISGD